MASQPLAPRRPGHYATTLDPPLGEPGTPAAPARYDHPMEPRVSLVLLGGTTFPEAVVAPRLQHLGPICPSMRRARKHRLCTGLYAIPRPGATRPSTRARGRPGIVVPIYASTVVPFPGNHTSTPYSPRKRGDRLVPDEEVGTLSSFSYARCLNGRYCCTLPPNPPSRHLPHMVRCRLRGHTLVLLVPRFSPAFRGRLGGNPEVGRLAHYPGS